MAEPIIQKNFRLPWALAQKLEKFAKETDITQQEIVIRALENYLKEEDNNMIEIKNFQEFSRIVGDHQLAAAYWNEWFQGDEQEEKEYFAFNDSLHIRKENGEYIPEF
jgi:predicted DNA-binding protein